jgi:hypothetical protein
MKKDERELIDILFEFEQWSAGYSETDENSDVIFKLSDGSMYCGTFITYDNLKTLSHRFHVNGECLCGKYVWVADAVFIEKMDKNLIISTIKNILEQGNIEKAFCKISE